VLFLPMLFGAFQPPGPRRSFPRAENQGLASILLCPAYIYIFGSHTDTLYIKCEPQKILLSGFGG